MEIAFLVLVSVMCVSFAVLAGMAGAPGTEVLRGLAVPQIPPESTAYLIVGGIIGGCISPYNFFLYSGLVVNNKLPHSTRGEKLILLKYIWLEAAIVLFFALFMNVCAVCTFASTSYVAPGSPPLYNSTVYDYMVSEGEKIEGRVATVVTLSPSHLPSGRLYRLLLSGNTPRV